MIQDIDGRRSVRLLFYAVLWSLAARTARADVVLETRDLRLTIDDRGVCRGLLAKPLNEEFAWTQDPGTAFSVVRGKKTWPVARGDLRAVVNAHRRPVLYRPRDVKSSR